MSRSEGRSAAPLFAALFCFFAIDNVARAAELLPCTAEMLDVRVLPLLEPDTVNQLHGLVIEVENRSRSSCQLSGPSVELLPQSGADTFTNSFFSNQETSPSELRFQQRHSMLDPGDTAHVLVAWHSSDPQTFTACLNRDRLTLSLGPSQPPVLKVDHLWMRICGRAYISKYRAGHYVGEPLPPEWMPRSQAPAADFAALPVLGPPQPFAVEILSDRAMLHDYFELFLELPRPEFECPFVLIRRRDPDGLTAVYVNHCKILDSEERSQRQLSDSNWRAVLNISALGMEPEKLGVAEYEVFSGILHDGKPVYVAGKTSILIRDPTLPDLPTIDSPLPGCQTSQLEATKLPMLSRVKWHDAHIYDVTNISQQSCTLGGVPRLTFSHSEDKSYTWIPSPCPNCADPLFQPRPSGWIDLGPGESAHFIVGAFRFDTDAGQFRLHCDVVDSIDLKLPRDGQSNDDRSNSDQPKGDQSIRIPFGVSTCAQVNISAWRAGKYDGDPENLLHDKSATKNPPAEIPKDCPATDFIALGRPVFVREGNDMAFGLSASPEKIALGDPVLLHLWIDNQTEQEASVMTCMTLGFFWANAFDLYDAYGHRLLKKNTGKNRRSGGTPTSPTTGETPSQECLREWICSRNFPIPIPPHTCTYGNSYGLSYDFTRNLGDQYELPPGDYYVVPSANLDANMCRKTIPRLDRAALAGKLHFSIVQK